MKTYRTIHEHDVYYESDEHDISYGLDYLSNLSYDEAKVFFDQAYDNGDASFEDSSHYRYALMRVGGEYVLNCKR